MKPSRLETGTVDIIRIATQNKLKEPDFIQEVEFKAIIYRSTDQPTVEVVSILLILQGEMSRTEIQNKLGLKHRGNFRENYLEPALKIGLISMKFSKNPNHPKQKYFITPKGKMVIRYHAN